jgi:hypothetical protein
MKDFSGLLITLLFCLFLIIFGLNHWDVNNSKIDKEFRTLIKKSCLTACHGCGINK